jgi:pyruvate formate lyase activating enzyme
MAIVRVEGVSLVDWPGKISSVFHLNGCNFHCPWCFNKSLIPVDLEKDSGYIPVSIDDALQLVPRHVDNIVVTGGEPTVSKDIADIISKIKKTGASVAIHTNGSRPDVLKRILPMLDYVAMDIKGTLDMYAAFSDDPSIAGKVMDSMILITEGMIDHEFRTTAFPGVTRKTIMSIANILSDMCARKYYLQCYIPQNGERKGSYLSYLQLHELSCFLTDNIGLDTSVRGDT